MDVDLPPSSDGGTFATYCRNSAPVSAITLPDGDKASDFWFKSTVYQLPNAALFRAAAAAHVMHRGPAEIALGHRQIMLLALIEGEVDSVVEGRRQSIRAGDVAFFDHTRGYHSATTDFEMISVFADRDRVPPLLRLQAAHGAVLPAGSGAARLLHRTIAALLDVAGELSMAEATSAIDGLFDVAATALGQLLARQRAQAYGPDAALIEKTLDFVDQHLGDRNLTPLRIGREMGLSRSSLYRLFAPLGGVSAVVLRRRLDHAMRAFLGSTDAKVAPRSIAAEHGFASESHFTRAFRDRFGVTPRAFRDMVCRQDNAGFLAQAWRAGFISHRAWFDHLSSTDSSNGK